MISSNIGAAAGVVAVQHQARLNRRISGKLSGVNPYDEAELKKVQYRGTLLEQLVSFMKKKKGKKKKGY